MFGKIAAAIGRRAWRRAEPRILRAIAGPPVAKARDQSAILDSSLGLATTQLLAQIADETSLDGRTMGLLAFNGALLAADVAAKDILGTLWWSALPFVAVASAFCLASVFAAGPDLGPKALTFYASYGGQISQLARGQLLADLDDAFKGNAKRIKRKSRFLRAALGVLSVGLVAAALLIGLDRPSKVVSHVQCSSQCAR